MSLLAQAKLMVDANLGPTFQPDHRASEVKAPGSLLEAGAVVHSVVTQRPPHPGQLSDSP